MYSKHQNSSHLSKFKINCEKTVTLVARRYLYKVQASLLRQALQICPSRILLRQKVSLPNISLSYLAQKGNLPPHAQKIQK